MSAFSSSFTFSNVSSINVSFTCTGSVIISSCYLSVNKSLKCSLLIYTALRIPLPFSFYFLFHILVFSCVSRISFFSLLYIIIYPFSFTFCYYIITFISYSSQPHYTYQTSFTGLSISSKIVLIK